jgi:2-polyprenyl-3-methyl-5-hydroxy-6-metoxy-1,4-benzoquinol methylase
VIAAPPDTRFAFGRNWQSFLSAVDEQRIQEAERSLTSMLHVDDLEGRSFLDIGCGSGLFSLSAARLGASRIHSFDYDEDSVRCTKTLHDRYFASKTDWTVERGDATDSEYGRRLGIFDVVYAWGVLHHTGAMWKAMENTCARVGPDGLLFVAIYNDQGRKSGRWHAIKRVYNRLPARARVPYTLAFMLPIEARMFAGALIRGEPAAYVRSWTDVGERGMARWHDWLDWVGGFPFEVATPEEVFHFCRERGLELIELTTAGGGLGCNQFVFRRVV